MLTQDLLADLTPAQSAAVTHGDGPMLVLAGAGSGKTRVITRRIAHLIQCGVRHGSILAITFTNKAATEMRHRVDALVPGHRVQISTFHSFGVRLLRQYADRFNIDRNFTIYDTDDRVKLVKNAMELANIDNVKFKPEQIVHAIGKAKNDLQSPKAFANSAGDFFSQNVARVYVAYEKRLREANAMDFDDLLYLPAMALKLNEELRAELDNRYRYVLIDEYQDTNTAQYEIAHRLSMNFPNLCVVGDPDQNVYRWRGSDLRNILDFERDFPGAKVVTLDANFRSTQAVIAAANSLIKHNKMRKDKTLVTKNPPGEPVKVLTFENGLDEAEGVAIRIKEGVVEGKYKYKDVAVFLRMNALTRSLESAFVKHGVAFQIVKGLAFFERKENKDILAYLKLLVNPSDPISFLRCVNEPARGVGKVSLDKLVLFAQQNELPLVAACGQIHRIPEIKGKATTGLRDFFRLITELRAKLDLPPQDIITAVIEESGYKKMLETSKDEDDADRLANILELVTAAKQFHDQDNLRTLADFLEQITLSSDTDQYDEKSDCVSIMTLHAAKGLEFPVVYIIAAEQGILPHNRALESNKRDDLEEERRLCFVGITRAMKDLSLTHARMREFRGQFTYAVPSMFLDELPKDVERVDRAGQRGRAVEQWRTNVGNLTSKSGYSTTPSWQHRGSSTATETTLEKQTGYEVGQVVQHDEYGIGKITELSGFGALKRVKIRFPAAGEKTFVADKVKLKVVKRG